MSVDIVVVSYNHSHFLEECLDSIKNQSYDNWNLIIADDASPDNSVDVINNWLDTNGISAVTVFNSENKGLCATLNDCLSFCKEKYVKLIAADDYLSHDYLLESVSKFEELDSDYMVLYSNAMYIDGNSQTLPSKDYYLKNDMPSGNVVDELYKANFIAAPSVILKREIFEKVGYYNPHTILEDYDLWLKTATNGFKIFFLNKTLTFYRIHDSNQTLLRKKRINTEKALLKMKYDLHGKYGEIIGNDMLLLYKNYKNLAGTEVLESYNKYKGKKDRLYKALIKNENYYFYKIIDKLFY